MSPLGIITAVLKKVFANVSGCKESGGMKSNDFSASKKATE